MKVIIADSGSSKTEWRIVENGIPGTSLFSAGFNPYFVDSVQISSILKKELPITGDEQFDQLYFYGTGCNSVAKEDIIKNGVKGYLNVRSVFVGSDLLGAARSLCLDQPGIACIMGTGSNSCYYDGTRIFANIPPLGYILGDEGGGAVMGRKLVAGILKKQFNESLRQKFMDRYKLTTAEILDNVYTKPFPNRFLGNFAVFLSENIEEPEIRQIINTSFEEFIVRNILQYPESLKLPVHFTGSIAFHFSEILVDQLRKFDLQPGIITHTPMENLVKYHLLTGI